MMKSINLISLSVTVALFMVCSSDVEKITVGRMEDWYIERTLVKNIPRNKVRQSKIMINYFDSVGLTINDILEMPGIKNYTMDFFKLTNVTRRYFIEKRGSTYNGNKTYLGYLHVGHCKNDSTKWRVLIARNLGTADSFEKQGPNTKDEYLLNDCDPNWYEANKDNVLVRYYMELRNRRKANDEIN